MANLKLLRTVKVSEHQTMAIYELTEEQAKKFGTAGKRFMLKHAQYGEYAMKNFDDARLIQVDPFHYEGFFETEREAYLSAELVRATSLLKLMKQTIEDSIDRLGKYSSEDFFWDCEFGEE